MTDKDLALRVGSLILQLWQLDCAHAELKEQVANPPKKQKKVKTEGV